MINNPLLKLDIRSQKEFVFIVLYALTEFVPSLGAFDVAGSQWLYLSILNGVVLVYFLIQKVNYQGLFFRSVLFFLYLAFLFVSLASFFVAYNVLESIVTYSRLLVCFITLINIYTLISRDTNILKYLFIVLGLTTLLQSVYVLVEFLFNYGIYSSLDDVVYNIKGNTGHKNILAASLVLKIPFLIYTVHASGAKSRIFFLVSVALCFLSVFILNVRSSFLGLFIELLIYSVLMSLYYFKSRKKLNILRTPFLIGIALVISVAVSQLVISMVRNNKTENKYGTVLSRVESIDFSQRGSSGRSLEWSHALDFIKKHPVLGGGYGNWRINNIPYEKYYQPGFIFNGRRVHNDFLQITADTGILGGLIYAGIFICILIYVTRLFKSKDITIENKMVAGAMLLSLSAYLVDATLNFPFERPNMQAVLAIVVAIIVSQYFVFYKKSLQVPMRAGIIWGLLLVSGATFYFSYESFKSMCVQKEISSYWIESNTNTWLHKGKDSIPFNAETEFPWIPNIDEWGLPVTCIKAKFLMDEQKYDKALTILNADKGSNPYTYYPEYLRSMVAEKLNEHDTAYYYAKLAYYNRPANLILFYYLYDIATKRKNTIEMEVAFDSVVKRVFSPVLWHMHIQTFYQVTGNAAWSVNIAERGLKESPTDSLLLYQKYFYTGCGYFKNEDYTNAINAFKQALLLKNYPAVYQNIAFSFFRQHLFSDALPYFTATINTGAFKGGEMEFLRGVCYQNTGKSDSACADFQRAKLLGYIVDSEFLGRCK